MSRCFLSSSLLCGMKGFFRTDSSVFKSADLYKVFCSDTAQIHQISVLRELCLTAGFEAVYSSSDGILLEKFLHTLTEINQY